jgi:hypothetical protein
MTDPARDERWAWVRIIVALTMLGCLIDLVRRML